MITKINLKNLTTNKEIEIGTNKSRFVLGVVDFGKAPAMHNTTDYINLIGSNVTSSRLGSRAIAIKGAIIESIVEKKTELNRLINPLHILKITYGDYVIFAQADSSVLYSTARLKNNIHICEFLIQATAYMPLWQLKNQKVYRESKITPVTLFPLKIPKTKGIAFGYIPAVSIANVPNPGDVEAGFTIRFNASAGKVTNPRIVNNKTGKHIEAVIDMEQGDVVEISTVAGSKSAKLKRGSAEIDIFKAITKQSSMDMTLNVGINDISVTAAGNSSNLSAMISFTPMWLEVQT